MRRQSMIAYRVPLCETVAPTPVPSGTEVLVRIRHCGVCHSDLHLQDGFFDLGGGKTLDVTSGRALPFTLGHEIEGEVEAIGPDVDGVALGDRRVVYAWIGCRACAACAAGEEHLCARPRHLGIDVDGGYASHVLVPHPRYLLAYDGVPTALAGSYMCSGLTAYAALKRLGGLGTRGPVLLIGAGGVGMMGLAFAKAMLPHAPIVADISAGKRAAALAAGAALAIDPADPEARRQIAAATGGGIHGAVDFVGSEASLDLAQRSLRKGGKVVVVGLMGGRLSLPIPFFPMRVVAIEGTYVGSLAEAAEMMALVRAGRVPAVPVETRPLEAANAALDDIRAGRAGGRIVLTS